MGIYTIIRGSDYDAERQEFTEQREQEIQEVINTFESKIVFVDLEIDKTSEEYENLCGDIVYEIETDMENKWYIESVDDIEVVITDDTYQISMNYNYKEDGSYYI